MQDRAGEAGIGDLIYLDHNATTPIAARSRRRCGRT